MSKWITLGVVERKIIMNHTKYFGSWSERETRPRHFHNICIVLSPLFLISGKSNAVIRLLFFPDTRLGFLCSVQNSSVFCDSIGFDLCENNSKRHFGSVFSRWCENGLPVLPQLFADILSPASHPARSVCILCTTRMIVLFCEKRAAEVNSQRSTKEASAVSELEEIFGHLCLWSSKTQQWGDVFIRELQMTRLRFGADEEEKSWALSFMFHSDIWYSRWFYFFFVFFYKMVCPGKRDLKT